MLPNYGWIDPAIAGTFVLASGKPLTERNRHVLYSFMKNERPRRDSAAINLKNWPIKDDHLEMFERHIGQLTRLNEIGISMIENLDKEAAALVAADMPLPASASKALHKLAREIHANRKMMAEISENRRHRLAQLGIAQH